jgi:hypothetical protein
MLPFNAKILKDEEEHEEVVYTQRTFYQIACKKFERWNLPLPKINANIEYECNDSPDNTQNEGLF